MTGTANTSGEVRCVAINIAKPGYEKALEEALANLVPDVRQEAGFIQYDLHRDLQEPRRFIITERWVDEPSFQAHCTAPHVNRFIEASQDWLESGVFFPMTQIC